MSYPRILFLLGISVATGAFAAAGCSVAPAEGLDSNDSALIGAVHASNEAFHVGRVNLGPGFGLCTGTLITPSIVVTAAHCLGAEAVTSDQQGGDRTFTVERNGQRHVFEIDRYRTLRDVDIGIAYLVREVPGDIATGAPLATHAPPRGESVTTYGYGCANTGSPASADVKRKASYRFGETGRRVCPGDEGGPTFDRHGALVQVTSGVVSTTGADVFAAVPPVFRALTKQMLAWRAGPCDNANPATSFDSNPNADVCVATTYYCNPYQDLGDPVDQDSPAPGYGSAWGGGCGFNGWSGQPDLPYMWQHNTCKSCEGDCWSACW